MNDLRKQLIDLVQKLGLLEEQQTKCCDLSLVQCHALSTIVSTSDLSVNDLAANLNLDKSTTSRHVTNLVKMGLVERRENEEDRRYFTLHATAQGNQVYETIDDTMEAYYKKLLANLDTTEQEKITEALGLLLRACDALTC